MFWWVTPPMPDVQVPQVRGAGEQPVRIDVEVLLGVGADLAGRGEQQRDVGDQRDDQRRPGRAPGAAGHAGAARAAAGPGAVGTSAASRRRPCGDGHVRRAAPTPRGEPARPRAASTRKVSRAVASQVKREACASAPAAERRPLGRVEQHPAQGRPRGRPGVGTSSPLTPGSAESRWPAMSVTTAGRAAGGGLGERHAPAFARRGRGEHPGALVEPDQFGVADPAGQA